jgi:iron complex outermembrane recepter protein
MKIFMASMLAVGLVGTASATNEVLRLAPVVVTAPVETAPLQNEPVASSSWERADLTTTGIEAAQDLPLRVPNLALSRSVARSFGDVYSIRGVGNTQFFSDPGVITYVDDAPAGSVFTYATDLLDVERIEVFRGPQGTVFGQNSEAGVINIVTRKPTDEYHASAEASYGTFNTQTYRVTASGPIVPGKLRLGVAGQYARSDGFLEHTANNSHPDSEEGLTGRAYVEWTPTENWDISLTATGEKFHDSVRIVSLAGDARQTSSDTDSEATGNSNSETLRIARTLPGVTITSITTRRDYELDPLLLDLDLSSVSYATANINRDENQWSEELRFESPAAAKDWRWQAGLYLATRETKGDDTRTILGFPLETVFTLGEDNYAVFGQVSRTQWEKLDLTLGLRLDYTIKGIYRTKNTVAGLIKDTNDYFTAAPKLTVGYHCATNVLTYVSTGLGFKPGGYSAFVDAPASPEYDTELNWANEIGVKTSWFDDKLLANVALFYNYIHDYQVESTLANLIDQTIVNAPEVTSRGVELELIGKPLTGLELSGAFGYTDIRFDRFNDPDTGTDLSGNQPTAVPEFTATIAAQYKHRCGAFARIEFQGVGRTFYDEANSANLAQSSYGLLNARLGYEARYWSVCVYGKNLTDTEYYSKKISELNAGVTGTPLTVGVLATLRY